MNTTSVRARPLNVRNAIATRRFTAVEVSRIVNLYRSGVSMSDLAIDFGSSVATIRRALVKNGATIRPRGGYARKN